MASDDSKSTELSRDYEKLQLIDYINCLILSVVIVVRVIARCPPLVLIRLMLLGSIIYTEYYDHTVCMYVGLLKYVYSMFRSCMCDVILWSNLHDYYYDVIYYTLCDTSYFVTADD